MRRAAILLSALLVLALAGAAPAQNNSWVYLIESDNPALQAQHEVRHTFKDGFTTRLTQRQADRLEARGISVQPLVLHHITAPPGACTPWPGCKDDDDDGGDSSRATPADQTPWGIEAIYNDSTIAATSGGAGVDVAVLDTGVQTDHPDLTNRIADCKDFTKGNSVKNGCKDGNGHGTHVSGTILADAGSDDAGIYGVAPSANLLAYKVCGNSGSCWSDDIAAAIDYAGSHDAEIISMSLGADSQSSLIADAISRNPHVLIVAAAGNDGPSTGSIDYPGANPAVMAAGAIDESEAVPDFSSRGVNDGDYTIEEKEVEFGAPGVSVLSTWNDGTYNTISGTSMATPHVSGLAAKLWQGSASDTRAYLQDRAAKYDLAAEGDDPATGFGLPTVG